MTAVSVRSCTVTTVSAIWSTALQSAGDWSLYLHYLRRRAYSENQSRTCPVTSCQQQQRQQQQRADIQVLRLRAETRLPRRMFGTSRHECEPVCAYRLRPSTPSCQEARQLLSLDV